MTTIDLPVIAQLEAPDAIATRERVIVRVFAASREQVFRAWTDPVLLAAWWGPYDGINTACTVEPYVGGRWSVMMRSATGEERSVHAIVEDVGIPERLVLVMTGSKGEAANARITVLIEELDDLARLTVKQTYAVDEHDAHPHRSMRKEWGQSLDSLEELLLKGRVS